MQEWWNKARAWWLSLAPREQHMTTIGLALLGVFFAYQFILQPYLFHISMIRKDIDTNQRMLAWMQAADQAIQKVEKNSTGENHISSPVVLLSFLQHKIKSAGLEQSLTQLKQASNEAIEMHYQKVDFDKLVSLLINVIREQHVTVTQFSVQSDATPGVVNADIVIKLG